MENTGVARPDLAAMDAQTQATTPTHSEKHFGSDSEAANEPKANEPPARNIHGWKWFVVVSAILSSTFLFALDNTVVADVQPDVIETFGDVSLLPWLGVGFALGGVTILPWGKAYGIFNLKWTFITNIVLFEAGSALCGAAPSMRALIVGRVLAGVGGAGMYVGSLTYLSVTTTTAERPMYMGLTALVWGGGTVLGPIVGGAFAASNATWRWAFYINLLVGAVFSPAYLFLLPSIDFQQGKPFMKKLLMLDWIGTIFFLAFLLCLTMAMSFGGTLYAWDSGSEITLWIMTGVTFVLFALVTKFHPLATKETRLYPAHFLRNPIMVNLQIQLALVSGTMLATAYYLPLIYQFADGDSAIRAGVRLLPFIVCTVVFALLNGIFLPRTQYYMPWYLFGSILMLAGGATMYTVTPETSASSLYGYSVLIGAGAGSFLQAGYAVSQTLVDPSEIPNVVGFMSVGQDVGIVILLSVAGSIYQNKATLLLKAALPDISPGDLETIASGTANPIYGSLSESDKTGVIAAIVASINDVFILVIAASAVCCILAVFLGTRRLSGGKK